MIVDFKEEPEIIETKDIYFAAALLALGGMYIETDKSDKRHMMFKLSVTNLREIESNWINSTLMVNAVLYKNALQQIKAIIHTD